MRGCLGYYTAARLGDGVALALLNAVHAFEAGCAGKQCLVSGLIFHMKCEAAAFWISDKIAIGICQDCAASAAPSAVYDQHIGAIQTRDGEDCGKN